MENPYAPWQTPRLKMDGKRTPLASCEASASKQQRTPPPSGDSFIWRTRSLDDGRSTLSNSDGEDRDESLRNETKSAAEEQPLHASFDASLLENDDPFHSIFRVSKRRGSASGASASAAATTLTRNASSDRGRKHLRQQPKTASAPSEEDELICPGTVRKLARHNSNESSKSKGTPVRPPTHWRSNSSRLSMAAPQSVFKPPLNKFPLTPTAPNSTATTLPPTTQERPTHLLEVDSMATNNSPSPTPFRFTSFPASLPRVHPPPFRDGSAPDSVRKRMFPSSALPPNHNLSREEDGTQNTSISSLSTHGEEDPRMPPVHTRLFMEEEYAYSDDDEDEGDDDDNNKMPGPSRLNFNLLLSPKMPLQKDVSPFKDLVDNNDVLKMEDEDATAPTDLSRPYEPRHVQSFPSTMSSHTLPSRCDDLATTSTAGLTAHHKLPETPEEVQLHFQFEDAAQCSPIPKEEELRTRKTASRLPPKPQAFKSNEDAESVSSTASAKLRRFRPMPDMSAFEMDSHSRSRDENNNTMSGPLSSPLLCPPTPVRTPAWAHTSSDDGSDARPGLQHHHHRSNSLIMTRVLATCSPQQMDPNYAAEADKNDTAMDVDPEPKQEDTTTSSGPEHPEAPPPIRRSVGEMGSIISFATDFETLGILGKGAFADVYKVRHKLDNRLYAVKRNRRHFRGKRDRDMALAEVRSMQRLQQHSSSAHNQHQQQHTNEYLLFFYRAWQEDGHFFCQTELCCRDTCRELMDNLSHEWCVARQRYPSLLRNLPGPQNDTSGRLVPDMTVWKICHDICAGLSHIHSCGLVHNDIKPSNIFFVSNSALGSLCKIGDFGMAGATGTSEDGHEGDQKYMPQEGFSGVKRASSDIFSLGLTLYELAAGPGFHLAKEGPRWHDLRNGAHVPELPPSRDSTLGPLIQQMISASPDKRPCADAILKHEKARVAGSTCDQFLRDYIKDIEEYDRCEEERRVAADQMADEQTPRTGAASAPCRARVCSPTLGYFPTTTTTNIFTPEAQ